MIPFCFFFYLSSFSLLSLPSSYPHSHFKTIHLCTKKRLPEPLRIYVYVPASAPLLGGVRERPVPQRPRHVRNHHGEEQRLCVCRLYITKTADRAYAMPGFAVRIWRGWFQCRRLQYTELAVDLVLIVLVRVGGFR